MSANLDPLEPARGVEMYKDARQDDLSEATLDAQQYRLKAFVAWCREEGVENLNDLSGRDLYAYRVWRREGNYHDGEELKTVTLRGQLATLRSFLHFAADIDAVHPNLAEKVPLPSVSGGEDVSETTLDPERAPGILDYLAKYEYASRRHVTLLLAWHTGARMGGLRALDVGDCDLESADPSVEFVHRPTEGTPLKNGEQGERVNIISDHVARVLRDYIDGPRKVVTDDNGRVPLLTTKKGRPAKSTVRADCYKATRPCWIGQPCPHDRDPEECDATDASKASTCPSSRSPHDIRSGRVTSYRRDDVPRRVVSDRLDASEDVLDKHYDRRSERQKAKQRRDYLPDL